MTLGPGKPRLVVFFATWLTETSDLKAELTGLNSYVAAAAKNHLPALTAVDETVTEPSAAAVSAYLGQVGPLSYPVALDETGRVADGYGVQDQPWLVLVSAAGKVVWTHDGWLPLPALEKAAAAHAIAARGDRPDTLATVAERDWYAWHAPYDDPDSGLSRRLSWVQDRVRAALDEAPPGPLRAISLCAGQGARPDRPAVRPPAPRRRDRAAGGAGSAQRRGGPPPGR